MTAWPEATVGHGGASGPVVSHGRSAGPRLAMLFAGSVSGGESDPPPHAFRNIQSAIVAKIVFIVSPVWGMNLIPETYTLPESAF